MGPILTTGRPSSTTFEQRSLQRMLRRLHFVGHMASVLGDPPGPPGAGGAVTRLSSSQGTCPIPETHDRLTAAHHFLHGILDNYHNPDEMRWNLNAFLEAARSVTWVMQKEMAHDPGFAEWYEDQQARMRANSVLRTLVEKRNYVVKQGNLAVNSRVRGVVRLFLSMTMELTELDLSPEIHTAQIMAYFRSKHPPDLPAQIEIGIQRLWRLEEAPETEVGRLCGEAWTLLSDIVSEAHGLRGFRHETEANCLHHFEEVTTRWESELTEDGKEWYREAVEKLRAERRKE
jgi:hypothetical protein